MNIIKGIKKLFKGHDEYIEKLDNYLNITDDRLDIKTRISPVVLINDTIYFSEFRNDDFALCKHPETHSEIIALLQSNGTLDLNGDYDFCRAQYEMDEEEEIETYAFGHLVEDHNGNEVVVWEDFTYEGYESDIIKAISNSEKEIEHFCVSKYGENLRSYVEL